MKVVDMVVKSIATVAEEEEMEAVAAVKVAMATIVMAAKVMAIVVAVAMEEVVMVAMGPST